MSKAGQIVMDVLIQRDALDAAISGSATGIVIAVDYFCLLIASVVGLAVILERLIRLRARRLAVQELAASLPDMVQQGDLAGAARRAQASTTILGPVLATELEACAAGHVTLEEGMEAASELADDELNANLDILSSVAKIAPLLGLLGTVLGMMYAFGQLDIGTRKETLAHGITAALDTTVRGLIIAIFCLTCEGHFLRVIDRASRRFAAIFSTLVRASRLGRNGN
ncbi:MAG: MotA/TolQ/ExbB proton channel family protein [Verrucomicrobia bacterium]|nr:MotA/TolQ/ExbB proton channel family protein [Verrucomicrobiota bacterium]